MIARALSTEPSLLLADEPTGSLDSQRRREVLELLRELCREQGVALVLVSHDPLAAGYADRVFALRDGKLTDYRARSARRTLGRCAERCGRTQREAGNVLRLYRVRLRARLVQECFAIVGIAAGVALLFASQVASQSLQSSVAQLSHGIVGNATLQLLARDPQGLPEAARAGAPHRGVRVAAPLLEASAERERPEGQPLGRAGRRRLEPAALGGTLVRHTDLEPFARHRRGACCPRRSRAHLGVTKFGKEVTLRVYGSTDRRRSTSSSTKADRRAGREPDRRRAALLRPGNDGPCRTRLRILVQPAPGAGAGARGAACASRPAA